jgi:hypothetical protein
VSGTGSKHEQSTHRLETRGIKGKRASPAGKKREQSTYLLETRGIKGK